MSSHFHLDATFEVWNSQQTWFWLVDSPFGGTIGAAVSEAQAIADACSSIEETRTARPREYAAALCWNESLASLDCYLRACSAGPQ
jgi:hypothetical protein